MKIGALDDKKAVLLFSSACIEIKKRKIKPSYARIAQVSGLKLIDVINFKEEIDSILIGLRLYVECEEEND